ncbi:MAG: glycerophosphodiester phosphodiesterase family protein, partial [Sarcina sp.]
TIPSIKLAIDSKAKYAEIDVQETKDGKLILTHDSNFKRTTGVNKNVWDVTYDEIKNYNAGKYFKNYSQHEKIPTLDEVLKLSKNKIELVIEIKLHGHEKGDIVKKVINLIEENKMTNDCVIASNSKNMLQEAKKLDPNIRTCYITLLAYGEFYNLDYVDIYSIESTFVKERLVNNIHEKGKQIFAWTINKGDKIEKMIDLNVDGIVTDNPYLVLDALYWKENSFVKEVADYFFGSLN